MITVLLLFLSQLILATPGIGKEVPRITHRSILGIWRCTPETALKFPEGTLEPVILIMEDTDSRLTARGCFLWDGLYYDQWEIKEVHYSDSTATVRFTDGDNSVFNGTLNMETGIIKGFVHPGDPGNGDSMDALDFIRADSALMHRLFYPRMPDAEGKAVYAYQTPIALGDGLETASIMDKIIALGYGGQYIFIIRDLNLMVTTTASDYGNGLKARSKVPMVIEELVPLLEAPK